MPKESLNLSLDSTSIEKARRYSRLHSTSISKLVEDFLSHLPVEEPDPTRLTPTVRRLLGIAAGGGDVDDYHKYLEEKYGR